MIINRILNCVSEDRCFDELKAEVASLSDFTQKLIQEAVINGDSGVTCSKSIKYNPYKAVSQSNNKASTIIFPLKAKALVTLQIMMNLSKHDEFDTDQKFSFEISRSRPSTPLSSPLRSFSPLLLIETFSRKSLTYGKLPLEPIKLTVLKLDGSSFDISVVKDPTVSQLKQAVADAFSHFPQHGIGKVSWSHVWAQFCLCFDGQKLLNDQDTVILNGIKDGDQLQFVRHTSISYNLVKERSDKHDFDLKESKASPRKRELKKNIQKEVHDRSSGTQDNLKQLNNEENEDDSRDDIAVRITCQWSWAYLLRHLFSYRRHKGHDTSYEELGS